MSEQQIKEFYPLMSRTLKTLFDVMDWDDYALYLPVVLCYPNYTPTDKEKEDRMFTAIFAELDRQYGRWLKGGKNGNITK